MKVIIAGSRNITNIDSLLEKLVSEFEKLYGKISVIVSGNAKGVDTSGEYFAKKNSIPLKIFSANWVKYGKLAGILRNQEMGNYADGLIIIWEGKSRGTKHMLEYMEDLDKPIIICIKSKENLSINIIPTKSIKF